MSDPNQPPAPSKQTSSVPLKKETVRVTLKAADAPPAVPSASVPQAPPVKPPTPPTAPKPPTPPTGPPTAAGTPPVASSAPTAPPTTAPRPTAAAPAPTIPLRTAGGTTAKPAAAPAPTIKLATSTAPIGAGGGAPTLPKATVQLAPPTRPLTATASPSQMGTVSMADEEYETEESGLEKGLSIASFVAVLIVLGFQLAIANIWINAEDNPKVGAWSQILE